MMQIIVLQRCAYRRLDRTNYELSQDGMPAWIEILLQDFRHLAINRFCGHSTFGPIIAQVSIPEIADRDTRLTEAPKRANKIKATALASH